MTEPFHGTGWQRWKALLQCGSCRFAAFYFLPFYVALLDTHRGGSVAVVAGASYWILNSMGTELLNRLSDRVEDEINRPERTALCHVVGFQRIWKVAIGIWIVIGLADVAWWWRQPSLQLGVLLVLGIMAGIGYSYWLRLKSKKLLSLIALTFPVGGPFLIGWVAYTPLSESAGDVSALVSRGFPLLLVLGLFILSLAGIKDITDVAGDDKIGFRSLMVALVQSHASGMLFFFICLPFAAIGGLIALHYLPLRFIGLLLFLPISILFACCLQVAAEDPQRQALRELVYHYWFIFLATTLMLYLPTAATYWAALGTLIFWICASQSLHWSNGMRFDQLRVVGDLLRQRFSSFPFEINAASPSRAANSQDIIRENRKLVCTILADILELQDSRIEETADFAKDLGGDSLQKLELIAKLENSFRVRFTTEEAVAMNSVGSILAVLQRYTARQAS